VDGNENWSVRGNRGDANLFQDVVLSNTPDVDGGATNVLGANELGVGDPGPRSGEHAREGSDVAASSDVSDDFIAVAKIEALQAEDSELLVLGIEHTVVGHKGLEGLVNSPFTTSLNGLVLAIAIKGHLESRGSAEAFGDMGLLALSQSDSASSAFQVTFDRNGQNQTVQGRGEWAINQALKSFVSDDRVFDAEHQEFTVFRLERFDLGHRYEIVGNIRTGCNVTALSGSLPTPWAWVSSTKFVRAQNVRGSTIDIWGVTENNILEEIGVSSVAPDRPVFVAIHNLTSNTRREYIFETFVPFPPPARIFDVPRQCNATGFSKF